MVQGVPFKSGGGQEAGRFLCIQWPDEYGRQAECLPCHRGQNWEIWDRPVKSLQAHLNAVSRASPAFLEKIGRENLTSPPINP